MSGPMRAGIDVVHAANLKPGDIYAGNVVPDAPTRPVQEFAAAWRIDTAEQYTGEDGRKWMRFTSGEFALTPVRTITQCLVIRGLS